MGEGTRLEIANGVAWLTLDDGKVNALSSAMIGEIDAALDAAEQAGAVVVLGGRAGIFSAGFDHQRGHGAGCGAGRHGRHALEAEHLHVGAAHLHDDGPACHLGGEPGRPDAGRARRLGRGVLALPDVEGREGVLKAA